MNRQQRRAQAKHNGRVTPKKDKAPVMYADVTDGEGNTKRIRVRGEELSPAEVEARRIVDERSKEAMAQQEAAKMRVRAHVQGLWIPGDPMPGQP